MRRIAVVVHAEAQHHVDRLVGGWFGSPLTERGREQARRVGLALQGVFPQPHVPIFSSDLLRARETAGIVGGILESPVTVEQGLRELSYGVAEGQPKAWLDERITPTPTHGSRLDHRVCEGAESRRDIATRVYATMNCRVRSFSSRDFTSCRRRCIPKPNSFVSQRHTPSGLGCGRAYQIGLLAVSSG
jgi:probable phosphoglycerate mutase